MEMEPWDPSLTMRECLRRRRAWPWPEKRRAAMSHFLFLYTNGRIDELNFDGVRAALSERGHHCDKMEPCLSDIPNVPGGSNRMHWSTLFEPESVHYRFREAMVGAHLAEVQPDVLVVCQDWHPLSRQPVMVARDLGITTVCVLGEGFFIEESEYYWGEAPIVDYMLVWGNLHREVFTKRGYPADRMRMTGAARMDAYAGFHPSIGRSEFFWRLGWESSVDKKIVTFATQPFGDQGPVEALNDGKRESLRLLVEGARRLGFLLVVKVHPLEDGASSCVDYAEFQRCNRDCVRVINIGTHEEDIDIHTAMYHSEVWCAYSSSTLLEARLMGKPAVELNLTGLPSVIHLGEQGVCAYAASAEELDQCLSAGMAGRPLGTRSGLQWALDRWLPGRFDGLNTERAVQTLDEIAGGRWQPTSELPASMPVRMLPSLVG